MLGASIGYSEYTADAPFSKTFVLDFFEKSNSPLIVGRSEKFAVGLICLGVLSRSVADAWVWALVSAVVPVAPWAVSVASAALGLSVALAPVLPLVAVLLVVGILRWWVAVVMVLFWSFSSFSRARQLCFVLRWFAQRKRVASHLFRCTKRDRKGFKFAQNKNYKFYW